MNVVDVVPHDGQNRIDENIVGFHGEPVHDEHEKSKAEQQLQIAEIHNKKGNHVWNAVIDEFPGAIGNRLYAYRGRRTLEITNCHPKENTGQKG
jgi:hypothetical protein